MTLPQIFLVRHGETAWTVTGQHTGRTDIPLTPRGELEAKHLEARLLGLDFATVFTSPLQRARRTCELAGFGPRAKSMAELMEWDYGRYEARRTADIRAERPGWHLYEDGCPDGETVDDVSARADRVIAYIRGCASDVLLFGHGDILRVVAARWLGLPAKDGRYLFLGTTSVSVLGYHHNLDEPVIRLWNDVGPWSGV